MRLLLVACLLFTGAAYADHEKGHKDHHDFKPTTKTVERAGTYGGKKITYTVTMGETVLKDDHGHPEAAIFSTAYIKQKPDATRPVFFIYNGGPGSSSVWLHMGAFGPKRVVLPSDAKDDGAPPYPIEENTASILDVTDMVFIDPVGTGFSKALGKKKDTDFHGVHADAKSLARFIRQWLDTNGRWNSPKYIGGESYGTYRSAALVKELEGGYDDVALNGIILISTVLDMYHDLTGEGAEMGYPILLPTMAATAWYHDAIENKPDDIEGFLADARAFAEGPYMTALMKGTRLQGAERDDVLNKLAGFTGLKKDYLDRANLRVNLRRFMKELLRDKGLSVGRLDSRFTGTAVDDAGEGPEVDPSFVAIDGGYTAALNSYVREDIGLPMQRRYKIITSLGRNWDWKIDGGGRFMFNVQPYIGRAMRQNSGLKVFNAAGYYDFATPFFSAEFSLQRPGMDQDRITYKYYPAGHMMYIHEPSLQQLNDDIRAFIESR